MKILAVDDDEMVLEILFSGLRASGYTDVDLAPSAKAAMKKIEEATTPYDCFMFDIQMPEMDGIDLCSWVRKRREYESAPILMVTAMTERSYIQRAFNAGATDYVTKPFDPLELSTRIKMADRLVRDSARAKSAAFEIQDLRDKMENDFRVPFTEPVTIFGVPSVIGRLNMENYLRQLSRSGLFSTSVFAVHVTGLEGYYRTLSASDYYFLLVDVAESLCAALGDREYFVSYAGSGSFLITVQHANAITPSMVERQASEALNKMGATQGFDGRALLQYRCGEPVRIGVLFSGGSVEKALDMALEKLERTLLARNEGAYVSARTPGLGLASLFVK